MSNQKLLDVAIGIILVVCLVSLVTLAIPISTVEHLNFDESIELTRAHLLSRNYIFFQEVWNDHPLGLPTILKTFANFVDLNLTSARYIVLGFSTINIFIFYFLLRLTCGRFSSILASLILITSFQYVPLSGTVLNELPSLTLVLLSVLLMALYGRKEGKSGYLYLLFCSLIFVLSLEIKLSGITVIPTLVFLGIFASKRMDQKIKDAGIWIACTASLFLLFSLTFLPFSYESLIGSHSSASDKLAVTDPNLTLSALIQTGLVSDTLYVLLPVLAVLSIFWTNRKLILVPPILWLGFNLLRFSLIAPVWPNYYIHLAIPVAWIIGIFINALNLEKIFLSWRTQNYKSPQLLLKIFLISVTLLQLAFNTLKIVTAKNPKRYQHRGLVAYHWIAENYKKHPAEVFFEKYKGSNKVILTDNPLYIHKYQLDTPPETAILSRKRLITEDLDGEFILQVVETKKPDFVFLDRFVNQFLESQNLVKFLNKNYQEYPLPDVEEKLFILKN